MYSNDEWRALSRRLAVQRPARAAFRSRRGRIAAGAAILIALAALHWIAAGA